MSRHTPQERGPITHQWAAVQEAYISVPFFCLSSIGSSQLAAAARESKGEIGSIHLLLPTGPALEATTPYHQENLGGLYFSYLLAPKLLSPFSPLQPTEGKNKGVGSIRMKQREKANNKNGQNLALCRTSSSGRKDTRLLWNKTVYWNRPSFVSSWFSMASKLSVACFVWGEDSTSDIAPVERITRQRQKPCGEKRCRGKSALLRRRDCSSKYLTLHNPLSTGRRLRHVTLAKPSKFIF
ncbi:hypothetical protein DAPPUDRAFT_247232 [Daphnia pulex]|uniref:Uncharacterized protein n=1 Tax=Daphnia pulex TaxID=6669 RepID=E9GS11_DAPPU|nr:hypothetical protein DAPPUDRAFT_247232 [Daphnia pulex]|eukprot:EFX77738.1 hypothetical protein DAPPUDRAFT_247232 [Daphnia pulex]